MPALPPAKTVKVEGIDVLVEGPADAPALVFLHGWPDSLRLWDASVLALRDGYRCIRFTLPGYDLAQPPRATSFARMVERIDAVLDATGTDEATLVLHDWGCVIGYEYAARRPGRVARIVGVDIGDHNSARYLQSLTPRARRMVFGYQVWLALAWKLGGRLGDRMARGMARRLRCPAPAAAIGAQMGYPYAIRWFGTLGGVGGLAPVDGLACPLLFVYGTRKPFMFHSAEWLAALQARPGCAVHALATGHWVMLNQPDAFHAIVRRWLDAEPAAAARIGA